MTIDHVEVIVEEPSMEAALHVLLPRILEGLSFAIRQHQCKAELLARLPERLRGYPSWLPETSRIMVLIDRDNDDCRKLKARLEQIAREAGLKTRSQARRGKYSIINRVVIEELEAWFFGDWEAVRRAYPKVNATVPTQAKYRNPDAITGGTWEALERVLQAAGYFKTGLRKIELARTVAEHMDPERNKSRSFQVFYSTLRELVPGRG
jgi:Domain of unknown function (DUF4276)